MSVLAKPDFSDLPQRAVWIDLTVMAALSAVIYGIIRVAREWTGTLNPTPDIRLEAQYLPLYLLYSLTRGVLAYGLSFAFTMAYGYVAARVRGADRILLPVLDILQSIPVLGFLPGFVLALVHLFPHQNIGLEIASVLMIFTGQVWNMTFAFYASLKAIPTDLEVVTRLAKLTWWQRFLRLELAFSATSLVWNSMVSMAGGWFFLTVTEAFVLGQHDFRLPGLGSYVSLAIEKGSVSAQCLGVLSMIVLILILDQLVWRPLVSWSQRFSPDAEASTASTPLWWQLVRRSRVWAAVAATLQRSRAALVRRSPPAPLKRRSEGFLVRCSSGKRLRQVSVALLWIGVGFGVIKYTRLLHDLTAADWREIAVSAALTLSRVLAAVVLASLWAIPAGVFIGRNRRWARLLQPIIQVVASFPAPMIFPLVITGVMALGGGLGMGSILLLLLGTQWYILFNAVAGTSAIPSDFWEVTRLHRLTRWQCWRTLILPALFPSLLTGWITAMGGAWNASIVAEYMKYQGKTLSTVGLGALISHATDQGRFHVLAAAVGVMAFIVVGFNRMIWAPLIRHAESHYTLGSN